MNDTVEGAELSPISEREPLFDAKDKLRRFVVGHENLPVRFNATQKVSEGVECETYKFTGDDTKDLAIVRVQEGHKTPLQRVLKGTKTIEGFLSGGGVLTVTSVDGRVARYEFNPGDKSTLETEVAVEIGQIMQWEAGEEGLSFYEICEPPYEDGRFKNLPEN